MRRGCFLGLLSGIGLCVHPSAVQRAEGRARLDALKNLADDPDRPVDIRPGHHQGWGEADDVAVGILGEDAALLEGDAEAARPAGLALGAFDDHVEVVVVVSAVPFLDGNQFSRCHVSSWKGLLFSDRN